MRTFWIIVALLVVATAVVMVRRGDGEPASTDVDRPATSIVRPEERSPPGPSDLPQVVETPAAEPDPRERTPEQDIVEPTAVATADPGVDPATPPEDEPADAMPDAREAADDGVMRAAVATDPVDEEQSLIDDLLASSERSVDDAATITPPDAGNPVAAPESGDGEVDAPAADAYEIRGAGTAEDPYLLTWELLTSAADDYRPRLGMTELPQRISDLHDTHVRITGYIAAPMATGEVDEILVMLNQWDGCCIGVPPSPYDSVEVRLDGSMRMGQRHVVPYGTVEGTLKIDPYLVSEWLVGLYLMEDAVVEMGM